MQIIVIINSCLTSLSPLNGFPIRIWFNLVQLVSSLASTADKPEMDCAR